MNLFIALFLVPLLAFPQVVARVNGEKIEKSQFEKVFNAYWDRVLHLSLAKPTKEDKRTFLLDYVRNLIILKEARRRGIEVSDKELRDFINKKIGKKIKDRELRRLIKAEILTEKLIDRLLKEDRIKVSEDELLAYYEFYKREFYYPTSVKMLRVFVEDRKKAQEVYRLLKEGKELESMEGVRVGQPLWFSISTLPRIVKRKMGSFKVGSVSRPIKVGEGYLILKVLDRREAGVIPFEKAKPLIKKKILKKKREEVFKEWFGRVLQNYDIKFYWENL